MIAPASVHRDAMCGQHRNDVTDASMLAVTSGAQAGGSG
jgi:hypothetical protein